MTSSESSDSSNAASGNDLKIAAQGSKLNYYIMAAMFTGIVGFGVANSLEPQIDSQYDFFELSLAVSQWVAGIFGIFVARRYWGAKVFGRAYLALGIGFLLWGIGSSMYTQLVMQGNPLPYPGPSDIFFVGYFLLLLYHLRTNIHFFRKKLLPRDKAILIAIPVTVNAVFVMALMTTASVPGSVPDLLSQQVTIGGQSFKVVPSDSSAQHQGFQQVTIDNQSYSLVPLVPSSTPYQQIPQSNSSTSFVPLALTHVKIAPLIQQYDSKFWPPFLAGVFYNTITTINLSLALVGVTIFRNSVLGVAWGVLLVGIAMNAVGDIIYDFTAIYAYDRSNPAIDFWVFGSMIVAYSLYLHRKNI